MTAQLSRELAAIFRKVTNSHIDEEGNSHCVLTPADCVAISATRMLLAGLGSEPVGVVRNVNVAVAGRKGIHVSLYQPLPEGTEVFAAPPAPAIPDHLELIDKGRLMMLERSHQTLLDYRADSVWYWQGDEDDQPEILSCPVIMSTETLRELLAKVAPPAPVDLIVSKDEIRKIFMRNGFTVKEGQTDLKDYVYDAAFELISSLKLPAPVSVPDEQHSERFEWSYEDWANHLGGRHQNNDPACYYEFGSFMAVAEMLRQFGNVQRKIGWNVCRAAMLKPGHVTAKCPKCGDTGLADSGGVQPWGEPISIPCDCTITVAPEQEV